MFRVGNLINVRIQWISDFLKLLYKMFNDFVLLMKYEQDVGSFHVITYQSQCARFHFVFKYTIRILEVLPNLPFKILDIS